MSAKVLQIVTDKIVAMLENGTVPWRKPWNANTTAPHNIAGYAYNGINFFLLSMLGHETPVYLTFNQIKKAGGRIKAGEEKKHAPVFFWKWLQFSKDRNGNELDDPRSVPLVRFTQVWNISQVDGVELPKRFKTEPKVFNPIETAQTVVEGYKNAPAVTHGGNRACYTPVLDKVAMPIRESFLSPAEYYSTLFHEFAHSTGHKSRLNRKEVMDGNAFGSHDYSVEELVAEMGAAYLCAHCGIDNTLENSAAYIQSWIKRLKDEPKMLMVAAARAQKAFKHIVGEPEAETEGEE